MATFDLTPDPKVLIALTRTPMQPLDALCELIDNSIDSFHAAELQGKPIQSPMVVIELPRKNQVLGGAGYLQIRDNATGLSADMAEKALRAGFSGNNPYDSLGLFGMGFNISTGKIGRRTRFVTARIEDTKAIEVVVDLDDMNRQKSYSVPVGEVPKPAGFEQGTLIEVFQWWPEGDPNRGFILKLLQYGIPKICEELGRRYSSILKEKRCQVVVNSQPVVPFEHCTWDDSRYVERKGVGSIPAVFRFDHVVGNQKRCTQCTALVEPGLLECQVCNSGSIRTIEERVRGWVGIQRFDDEVEFGIDLIRNGRTIRISEKGAFFEYTDEFKHVVKDYPIDSPYGRIVGEIHLNHVPVDFLKQDFQRNSPEWQRAMSFIRGDSSLQPRQPGADQNQSPIYKLYQGYRRVRIPGKTDLYMGFWDESTAGPKRISRDTEREYYERFLAKVPGYYDDAEWWKLVEQADKKPLEAIIDCPSCKGQNLESSETCKLCGYVLIGKECLNADCKKSIPKSAESCPFCGTSQVPEVKVPWLCKVCSTQNSSEATNCKECGAIRGELHPLSREYLILNSDKSDELSIEQCSVQLADGTQSTPIKVTTFITRRPIIAPRTTKHVPIVASKNPDIIEIFVSLTHPIFASYEISPEQIVASEIALFILDLNRRLASFTGLHSLSVIQTDIIQSRWANALMNEAVKVKEDISRFFQAMRDALPGLCKDSASDIFDNLPTEAKRKLADNLISQKRDIAELMMMKDSGEFLRYIDETTAVAVYREYTERFFDGAFWNVPFIQIVGLPEDVIQDIRQKIKAQYQNCLEDVANYVSERNPEKYVTARARASLTILLRKAV